MTGAASGAKSTLIGAVSEAAPYRGALLAQREPTSPARVRGALPPRMAGRRYEAPPETQKLLPRITRPGVSSVRWAQLSHDGWYVALQSSVHSHTFPARSAWPHFPSPFGDFDPTFCGVHDPPQ